MSVGGWGVGESIPFLGCLVEIIVSGNSTSRAEQSTAEQQYSIDIRMSLDVSIAPSISKSKKKIQQKQAEII